ncbi:MAG: DUF4214 domain-containing protein, partial [Lachnospiraceae bacterium]|nr:DUF4214 domain-containing protein [Lachnospiraceae bacterium]
PSSSSVRNVGGNYVINTTGNPGDGGTLNLKGNLIDKVGKDIDYTTINFNGTKEQTIDIVAGSNLGQLGGSNENIKVKKYFNGTLQKNFKLTTDEKKVYINNTLKLNSKSLTVPASVIAEADVYWGEGGKFVVKGDYIQKSGYIYINYGANILDISKSFKLEGIDANGKAVTGAGGFAWSPSDSTVINVGGNYILNTTSSNAGNGGTLNLKGNFTDKTGKYLSEQTLNFNGTDEQTINILENTELGKLGGSNENLRVKKYFNGHINKNFKVTSVSDEIIINKGLYIKGYKLTLDKDVISGKYVEIGKSGKLTVNGNYTQTGSSLYFSDTGSALEVTGNLSVQGIDSNGKAVEGNIDFYSTYNGNPKVTVGKNFLFYSNGSTGNLTEINVKGNFTDKSGKTWEKVNLIGNVSDSKKQTVKVASGGKINTLTLKSCPKFYTIQKNCYDKLIFSHKWDNGVVTKKATTKEEGIKTYTCTVCGETKTEKIAKLPSDKESMVKEFVKRFYETVLGRPADEQGLNDWTYDLLSGTRTGADVARGFALSDELNKQNLNNAEYIRRMYAGFFDRPADQDGFDYWVDNLYAGATREYVVAGFVNSQEFKNLCKKYGIEPGSLDANVGKPTQPLTSPRLKLDSSNVSDEKLTQYVERLYLMILGRPGEPDGINSWKAVILNGKDAAGTEYDAALVASNGFFKS